MHMFLIAILSFLSPNITFGKPLDNEFLYYEVELYKYGTKEGNNPKRLEPFVWYSTPRNSYQLANDLMNLYESLLTAGLLKIEKYEDKIGMLPVELLTRKRLWFEPNGNKRLDNFLCKLNKSKCKLNGYKRKSGEIVNAWTHGKNRDLIIPDIHFITLTFPQDYRMKIGDDIQSIVIHATQGCVSFNEECKNEIKNLNPGKSKKIFSREYKGKILVPTLGLEAYIDPNKTGHYAHLKNPKDILTQGVDHNRRMKMHQETIRQLEDFIPPSIEIVPQSQHESEPFYKEHQTKLFQRISENPDILYQEFYDKEIKRRPFIAIFDTVVDDFHCEFPKNRIHVHNEEGEFLNSIFSKNKSRTKKPNSQCGGISPDTGILDHGTHITGLIGSGLNKKGMVGINPHANIYTYVSYYQEISSQKSKALEIAKKLNDTSKSIRPNVFNLSWSYKPKKLFGDPNKGDPILRIIKQYKKLSLFVTAAGNDGFDYTDLCLTAPACMESENVLSVAALEYDSSGKPSFWYDQKENKGSNYGRKIHVAAPGKNILSTITQNRYGYLSGTSQATAIVSGAASLIAGKYPSLKPSQVKARLIYSSNLLGADPNNLDENLNEKLLGGEINIRQALLCERDQLKLRNRNISISYGDVNKKFIVYFTDEFEDDFSVNMKDVLRIKYHKDLDKWTILTLPNGDFSKNIQKYTDVEINKQSRLQISIKQKPKGSPKVVKNLFSVDEIDDFISSIKECKKSAHL